MGDVEGYGHVMETDHFALAREKDEVAVQDQSAKATREKKRVVHT